MGEQHKQEQIHILTEYSQKALWEQQLRYLWRTCFGDSQHYEDFYFDKVYAKNVVYAMEDRGMIHLNSYRCKVMGKDIVLPYIVGVATDVRYRRQGVMRKLLDFILSDMYEKKVPFTYLMPAKEVYYLPFGFRSISPKVEYEMKTYQVDVAENLIYLSYTELKKMSRDFQKQLFALINNRLEEQYDVFAIHDEMYFELLYEEKRCQSGDVVFCFQEKITLEYFFGMFAYAMQEDVYYVEQMIAKEREKLLVGYFKNAVKVKVENSYPYMIRIVHREAFLDLFGQRLAEICELSPEQMTDTQLVEVLFSEKNRVYFAEIV